MSDTPETCEVFLIEGNWNTFAKQLVRERDKWEETARIYCQNSDYHREMREKAERERDEARETLMRIHGATCTLHTDSERSKIRCPICLKRERDDALEQNVKLRDIAERAVEMKEQEVWGIRELPFSWKQLRAELDQLKEGGK